MKFSQKYEYYVVIIVLLFIIPINLSTTSPIDANQEMKTSAQDYDLTGSIIVVNDDVYSPFETAANILIDELNLNYTWEQVKSENEWCSGSGSLQDPYLIQSVFIDGEMYGTNSLFYAPILIRNSRKNFIIQGCHVIRSGTQEHNGGIRMENVTNGIIMKNMLNYNTAGVYLKNCSGNIIALNTFNSDFNYTKLGDGSVFYNSTYGSAWAVQVEDSYNNTISFNNVYNYFEGIRVHSSAHHKIFSNTIIIDKYGTIGEGGIILTRCNYSLVFNNTLVGVGGEYGVGDSNSIGNIIEENSYFGYGSTTHTSSEESTSITLDQSNYNTIKKNLLFYTYEDYLSFLNSGQAIPTNIIVIIAVVSSVVLILAIAVYLLYKKRIPKFNK
jgi:parallel beta-helix repeat protein